MTEKICQKTNQKCDLHFCKFEGCKKEPDTGIVSIANPQPKPKIKLNAGHQYWLDMGKITLEEAEAEQIRNNQCVANCEAFLLKELKKEKAQLEPNLEKIKRIERYFKLKNK